LKGAGFKLFVITNQSGIGRGYFTEQEYRAVESELNRKLGVELIDATYFCPDEPGKDSRRRKPSPAMVLEAARDHNLDLKRSFFIGDKAIDIDCGRNAGVQTVLVRTGYGHSQECAPDRTAENLPAAAEIVLNQRR
jgi:D-glycero-D-manno-heptose 1,7-bisphosphate phosphatase